MVAKIDTVSGTANTATGDQSFSITSFGTPVSAIFFASLGVTNGTEAAHAALSIGWCDGTRHRNHSVYSENGQTRTDGYTYNSKAGDADANDWVLTILDATGAVAAQAKWKQWDANGVTITWTAVTGTAFRIECVLVGGDATAYANDTAGAGGGGLNVTAPGFQPDVIVFAGCSAFSSTPASVADATFSFGFSAREPLSNAGIAWWVDDNLTTAVVNSFIDAVSGPAIVNGDTSNGNSVSGYLSTGFSLADPYAGVGVPQMYLALKLPGLRGSATVESSPAGTGDTNHTLSGLNASFIITGDTLCAATGTLEADDDASSIGVGIVGIASSVQGCHALRTRDAATTPAGDTGSLHDAKAVHVYTGTTATDAIVATYTAALRGGYTRNYTTAKAAKFASLVIGPRRSLPPKSGRATRPTFASR